MSDGFDERKKAHEEKFAHDSKLRFKAKARRDKLLGLWAAKLLGLKDSEAAAYAHDLVMIDLEDTGDENVFNKLREDFDAKGIEISDHRIRHHMEILMAEALKQIKSGD
jgi:hypothetical protein